MSAWQTVILYVFCLGEQTTEGINEVKSDGSLGVRNVSIGVIFIVLIYSTKTIFCPSDIPNSYYGTLLK